MRQVSFSPVVVLFFSAALDVACAGNTVPADEAHPACSHGCPSDSPEGPQAAEGPPSAGQGTEAMNQTEGVDRAAEPLTSRAAHIVDAPDRTPEDRALDQGRQPAALLTFFGVTEGQRVAELAAGGGYTAELLARAVGPRGHVWGQNTPFILQRFAEQPWSQRLTKPVMSNVTRIDSEFDAPLPKDVSGLDLVLNVLFYHDTVWMKTDRQAMNRAVFDALASGGIYGIVDHSAASGAGVSQAETLHRIEESVVREEVEKAGFVFDGAADFLRNPEDAKDWNASPRQAAERRGQSDRFVLRFRKPGAALSK